MEKVFNNKGNKLSMDIREAKLEDKQDIICFLKDHWKEDHIYVLDPGFFDYDYIGNGSINYILAKEGEEIVSALGFIDYMNEDSQKNVFLAIWKNTGNYMGGLKCLEYLLNKGYRTVSCCGINKKTEVIYKYLGLTTGRLQQYYLINNSFKSEQFKIAKLEDIQKNSYSSQETNEYTLINNPDEFSNLVSSEVLKLNEFFKSEKYFTKRYFEHPYYDYLVYGIKKSKEDINAVLVFREIEVSGAKCLRIMDFIGKEESLVGVGHFLKSLLNKGNYEYVDFYQTGICSEILEAEGFVERIESDVNIIPNYFEPFEQRNVEVYYMTNTKNNFTMFKGDGDQDRPSLAKELS